MATIHSVVAEARQRLRAAGISDAEADLDARLLARHVLGWDAARLLTDGSDPVPAGFAQAYEPLIARRTAREPVAYIVGHQEFWALMFEVTPAVLIPRPETELIVEAVLDLFPDPDARIRIADVCTGSGCLAVAIARERPFAHIVAIDVSAEALQVASRNAATHGAIGRVQLLERDVLQGVEQTFDAIVANPPYVPQRDRATVQPEVRRYEPAVALFADEDGLGVIRRLIEEAGLRLVAGGSLVFEFGFGQSQAVKRLVESTAGLTMVGLKADLQHIPRVAVVKRVQIDG